MDEHGPLLPESMLVSIAGYYHRATTTSRPMSRMIALVVLIVLGALGFQAALGRAIPVGYSPFRRACRYPDDAGADTDGSRRNSLAHRTDSVAGQSRLARSVCLGCVGCMLTFLVLWVVRTLST
ncbi:hypothetical protein OK015_15785 [Mycobacterium sp. Aquia_216]|uniref:hypothetical protein n=1 Tax=Mycobacterium sp. Aquia_216 TaxID=2991729 RepID=UPI00227D00B4|nr:hypothetical protein [Mycobacterium sp. Aquia_216]WAJ42732.1 hypothetical protein OK015_15785 [Mycobacterium sp. Aquia_216]